MKSKTKSILTSIAIALTSLALAYSPIPGLKQKIIVVIGSELQEPLQKLEMQFEQQTGIELELKIQGSQDMVNSYINAKNDFQANVLIPANGEILSDLQQKYSSQYNRELFAEEPKPIAKTLLVGIAWTERGKILFPTGKFAWSTLEKALQSQTWQKLGANPTWGSFDLLTTDPTRSNSGQLMLLLWMQDKLAQNPVNQQSFGNSETQELFELIKKSVYQPPRSTDILLQEFITRGPNDADVAIVYESIALSRWQQSQQSRGQAYQIYYLNPTLETISTAAILQEQVDSSQIRAARQFIEFLRQPQQQTVFVQYGFRPINSTIDIQQVVNNPWGQNIPGVQINPNITIAPPATVQILGEIQRMWERSP